MDRELENITYGRKRITPELAEEIIKSSSEHFKNRHINKSTVKMYAKDMANGKWFRNGETIKFNPKGYLNDGYHRLTAVIESNATVDFDVAYNVPDKLVPTIDVGRGRSAEDILDFYGVERIKGVMSVVRKRVMLDKKLTWKGSSCAVIGTTKADLTKEYISHKKQYDRFKELGEEYRKNSNDILSACDTGGISAHLVMSLGWSEEQVDDFFTKLSTESWNKSSIFSTTVKDISKLKGKSKEIIKKYYTCWNSFISGKKQRRHTELEWFIRNDEQRQKMENCVGVGVTSDDFGITNLQNDELEIAIAAS